MKRFIKYECLFMAIIFVIENLSYAMSDTYKVIYTTYIHQGVKVGFMSFLGITLMTLIYQLVFAMVLSVVPAFILALTISVINIIRGRYKLALYKWFSEKNEVLSEIEAWEKQRRIRQRQGKDR